LSVSEHTFGKYLL